MKLRKNVFFLLCIIASMNFSVRVLDPNDIYNTGIISNYATIIGIMFLYCFVKKKSKKNF